MEGKRHQAEQDRLDDQARDWIFNGTSLFLFSRDDQKELMVKKTIEIHLLER
jgi:hypothetical protein